MKSFSFKKTSNVTIDVATNRILQQRRIQTMGNYDDVNSLSHSKWRCHYHVAFCADQRSVMRLPAAARRY
jgi:hypothetical protein